MKYLVPYDFTPIADTALKHAHQISLVEPGDITLLHIAADAEAKKAAEKRFEALLEALDGVLRQKLNYRIRIGDIFKDISNEAEEANADLLVMGTHGAKGLQKVFGSHAIKVVTSSTVPFIITQEAGPKEKTEKIVLPVDLSHEKVQIAQFAADLSQKFGAEVHIVAKEQSDEFLQKRLRNNITKVKQWLKKKGVNYQVEALPGQEAFHKEVMDYGANVEADLYAIAHHPQTLIPQLEKFSQSLITNEAGTPVLIVNAKEYVGTKSNYAFVGI